MCTGMFHSLVVVTFKFGDNGFCNCAVCTYSGLRESMGMGDNVIVCFGTD